MKKIAGVILILLAVSLALQSCASRKSQYGCPERMNGSSPFQSTSIMP